MELLLEEHRNLIARASDALRRALQEGSKDLAEKPTVRSEETFYMGTEEDFEKPSDAADAYASRPTEDSDSPKPKVPFEPMVSEAPSRRSLNESLAAANIRPSKSLGKLKKQAGHTGRRDCGSRVRAFVRGPFDLMMGLVISINAVVMFLQTMEEGARAWQFLVSEEQAGAVHTEIASLSISSAFNAAEYVFIVIYTFEFVIRLGVLSGGFFYDGETGEGIQWSNMFDALILFIGIADLFILRNLTDDGSFMETVPMAKMLRFIKVTRALRLFRVVKLFRQLRILTYTILASVGALFWSMMLLLLLNAVGGMVLSQALQSYILDTEQPHGDRQLVFKLFGDSARAMYTMFEVTHSGCWPNYARPLIDGVSPWFACFFMIYVALVVFAIIRIISAIFLKETLHVASNDAVMVVQERMRERAEFQRKLAEFFQEADADGSGCVSRDEFEIILQDKHAASFLDSLDLQASDAHRLFDLLDDGSGQVTYDVFIKGCMRLKGQARSQDVISILYDQEKIMKKCHEMSASLGSVERTLRTLVASAKAEPDAKRGRLAAPPSKDDALSASEDGSNTRFTV
ncbi:Scn10a [Symbiodinium natans]|uniref:Scn10a protein n=1 Tax=Symbiodinium natans TaxID=878477 RepID=A0A812QPS3_9DINO|nr:Scn10a [Symbiodinium natans]